MYYGRQQIAKSSSADTASSALEPCSYMPAPSAVHPPAPLLEPTTIPEPSTKHTSSSEPAPPLSNTKGANGKQFLLSNCYLMFLMITSNVTYTTYSVSVMIEYQMLL